MPPVSINVMGIVIAVIVSMIIGGVWYGVFAQQWMKALDKKKSQMNGAASAYILQAVYAAVMAYVLAHIVDYANASTIMAGMQTGFWIWFGFVATTTAGANLWEGKSWDLWLINNGNYVLTLMAMGAILAVY